MLVTQPVLVLFLKCLEDELAKEVPDIHPRAFRVFTRILDSQTKPNGILATYNKRLRNDDGTVTPYNGTKYLLELLRVGEDVYAQAVKHIVL